MTIIVLRQTGSIVAPDAIVKDAPLTNIEVDNNFSNLSITSGVLSNLTTTKKSNLVSAVNELVTSNATANTKITNINSNIGVLSRLTTTTKANVVNAINEVNANVNTTKNNILADLANTASTKGATLIGYKYPRSGSVVRTANDKLSTFVTLADFGADRTGTIDCLSNVSSSVSAANSEEKPLLIEKGTYLSGGTSYEIDGSFMWFDRGFSSGVNVLQSARNSAILVTGDTSSNTIQDVSMTKVLISATVQARGAQHGSAIRTNLNNYSTDGNGCCGLYSRATSNTNAHWSTALHGETRHGGGTSIAVGAEAACYSANGTFYGIVSNNTTNGAEANHPLTGLPKAYHPTATALYIIGTNDIDPRGGWQYGIRYQTNALRANADAILFESPASTLLKSSSAAITSTADILLAANSTYAIILNGTYSSNTAIRMIAGQAIGFEATNAIRQKYDAATNSIQIVNGNNVRFSLKTTSTPTISLNDTQVLKERITGWVATGGTANRGNIGIYNELAAINYNQLQIQGFMDALTNTMSQLKALKDDLIAHGLIGS